MKKIKAICVIILLLPVSFLCVYCSRGDPDVSNDIRERARQSSVQTVFHRGVIHVSFTSPLPKPEELTTAKVTEILKEKQAILERLIEEALKKYTEEQKEDRWKSSFTDLRAWDYEPLSKTFIALGAVAPEGVKFPENILIACKTEKKEISPWEKEYEDDVLAISETANVAPSKAKEILSNIKAKGYTISKEEVKKADEIELLYFSSWDTTYPTHLNWKVTIMGEDNNLIIGYDPRGILEVRPIPEKKKVHIKAGYFDLKEKFKKELSEVTELKNQLETVKENLKTANEEIERLRAKDIKPPEKRDITTATFWDVKLGTVKLDQFFFMSAASGIFLGNMDIRNEIAAWGPLRGWGFYQSNTSDKAAAVILTNAHVAIQAMQIEFMVSEDKEHMWILFPGSPSIRYTKHSDYFGSPAWVLGVDQTPVVSHDCDAGILLSTPIPAYEKYKALLGNSDNVSPGDPIITVGNPAGMQKYSYQGVISNTEYSMLDALDGAYFLKWVAGNKPAYSWLLNTNFWIDCPGTGGVSGSGIWAMTGPEKGKVVAIRNAGMMQRYDRVSSVETIKDSILYQNLPDMPINLRSEHARYIFKSLIPTGAYTDTFDGFLKQNPDLAKLMEHRGMMPIPGLQIGVPINYIKRFLQERGLDPAHFKWEGLKQEYWGQ